MKKTILLIVLFPILVCAQSLDQNYVKTTTYKVPTSLVASPTSSLIVQNITYYDGLGRPIQQIAHQQSNSGKDIITPMTYDEFGRQTKEYLPYVPTSVASQNFKLDALNATGVFGYPSYSGQDPFSEKILESSPLNRIMKQAAPGTISSWAKGSGHEIKFEYTTNTANDGVRYFVVNTTWVTSKELFDIPLTLTSTAYPINQLYKTITYDENTVALPTESNGSTVEFKDKEGRVVLKRTYSTVNTGNILERHDTYYVYDQYGNLTFVLPPKVATNIAITATVLADLCYQYKYDCRNRLVEKKLPGKQWEFIVYDKLDRVIATGPALSPFSNLVGNGWMITKYDIFNRPVLTGWMPSTTVTEAGRKTLQILRNADTALSETKTATESPAVNNVAFNYTNAAFPASTSTYHVLTINYYDNYTSNLVFAPALSFTATAALPVHYNNTAGTLPKGLPTLSWVRVCETSALYKAEKSYILYDKKARPVRNFTNRFLGGYTQIDTQMEEMTGRVNYTITKHKRLASADTVQPLQVRDNFVYTDQDRLLRSTQIITKPDGVDLPEQLIAENTYDELGQLISKKVGNTSAQPLQKVDYTYNIRGWLAEINKTGWNDASNTNPLNVAGEPLDLFAFKINYNTIQNESGYTGKALFNGNIAETYWRTSGDNVLRKYGYFYDDINRLRAAIYQKPFTTVAVTNMYNESMRYDKNGNIMALQRYGDYDAQTGAIQIDNLTYNYGINNSTNQLTRVIDDTNVNSSLGFKNGTNTDDDYSYDTNGNMTIDKNKAITTAIKYNHLNLPTEIVFGAATLVQKITYLYTATGQKVQKTLVSGTVITTTDYLGGYQYLKAGTASVVLQYFPHAEGYVNFDTNVYKYVFNYTDHLGNIRVSYTKNNTTGLPTILEQNHYYPFGLKHTKYNIGILKLRADNPVAVVANPYKYKFNGKELQDELGLNMYDYGARFYDPAAPHFWQMDPKAELSRRFSPYTYCLDNPVFFVDPDGMMAIWKPDMKGNLIAEKGDNATTLAKYLDVDVGRAKEILKSNDATKLQVGDVITSSETKAVTKEIKTEIATTEKTVNTNNKETASLQKENKELSAENKELKNEVKINGTLMKSEPGDPKGGNAMAFTILNVRAENKISNNNQEIKGNNQEIQKNNTENKTVQENLNKTLEKYNVD